MPADRARELAKAGHSSRQIAKLLLVEGTKVSHVTVQKWLREHDEETREVARREVAAKARTGIGEASEALLEIVRLGMPLIRKAAEEYDGRTFQSVAMAVEKASNTLHKYAELATKGQERAINPAQVAQRIMVVYGLRPPEPSQPKAIDAEATPVPDAAE